MYQRTPLFGMLVISLLLLVPAVSAQASLDVTASASADPSGALRAVDAAVAHATDAVDAAQAEGQAHADAAIAETEAQAEAAADAGASAGARVAARLQDAFDGLARFASGIFASVQVDIRLG